MVNTCRYDVDGLCLNSQKSESAEEFCQKTGWICKQTCPLQISEYTGRDRDAYLIKCLSKVKKDDMGMLCVHLMECGHRANSQDDEYAILYDACIIRLIQIHARRRLVSDDEYCTAYEQARRCGIRLPGRSGKIYRRLKRNINRCWMRNNNRKR